MGSVLIEVNKHVSEPGHVHGCEYLDPKFGYCKLVGKYEVNGSLLCYAHMGSKIHQLVEEAAER